MKKLPEDLGVRALVVGMCEEYVESVANRVLNYLGRASPEAKRAFQNELDKLNLPIPGFRKASVALRSNPQRLKDPVRHRLMLSDELAGAALKIWMESQQPLREVVTERLKDIGTYLGISTQSTDPSENGFKGHWPKDAWERETDRFATLHDDFDADDIALMMCCVSGRLPGMEDSDEQPATASEEVEQIPDILKLLTLCAVDLEDLPISAPEWENDIPELANKIADIIGVKQGERSRAATFDSFIADIGSDFSPELSYLESDISSWSADKLTESADIARALGMCEELRSTLTELRAVRKSAPGVTKSAERERRQKNVELEDRAEGLLDRIGRLMSGEPLSDDDPPRRSAPVEEQARDTYSAQTDDTSPDPSPQQTSPEFELNHLSHENLSLKSKMDELSHENENLRTENSRLENENETLRSENRTLANDVQFLRADNQDIKHRHERLESEISDKEAEATSWRLAYEEESRIPRLRVEDVSQQIDDVGDAVIYAAAMFKDRLLLKPNSKSVVRDNPFEKPGEVWDALEWLATTYHDAKAGISSVPDFDLSVREACGWQYKSDQHETTKNKYREWYTVKANNKTYWLLEHIGTGASKDARHTIRIAFDWDKEEKVVVVGYIGQHQRTDAT